jgi:DnaJ-class molecular chaperone
MTINQKFEYPAKQSHCFTCRGKRTIFTQGLKGSGRQMIKCTACHGLGYLTENKEAVAEIVQAYQTPIKNNVPRKTNKKTVHEVNIVEVFPPKRRGRPPKNK